MEKWCGKKKNNKIIEVICLRLYNEVVSILLVTGRKNGVI